MKKISILLAILLLPIITTAESNYKDDNDSFEYELVAEIVEPETRVYKIDDGKVLKQYTFLTLDEEEVIEELADIFNVSESVIEDELDYDDAEDNWEIEVYVDGDDVFVWYEHLGEEDNFDYDDDNVSLNDKEEIYEEIAKELKLTVEIVESVADFVDDFQIKIETEEVISLDDIEITAERYWAISDKWSVEVEYGKKDYQFYVYEISDEDELIDEIADYLDDELDINLDDDEVEKILEFDVDGFDQKEEESSKDKEKDNYSEKDKTSTEVVSTISKTDKDAQIAELRAQLNQLILLLVALLSQQVQ